MFNLYLCPVCANPLHCQYRVYKCENGHTFDMAKEGYVNLMPVQHKKSQLAGDSKAMIQSRRAFLEAGHYDSLPVALNQWLLQHHTEPAEAPRPRRLIDVGCGEGFYTHKLQQANNLDCWGVDISKAAIIAAAKRYKSIQFAVASSYRLPYPDGAADIVMKIFAPADVKEISRVLGNQGVFISVQPAPDHLFELKQVLYDDPQPHSEEHPAPDGFRLVDRFLVEDSMTLEEPQDIINLLTMTPYYWHVPETRQQEVAKLSRLHCKIAFSVLIYQKT